MARVIKAVSSGPADARALAGGRAADLIWPRLMGGCHVERRTRPAIGRAFTIERCRGFRFPPSAAFSPVAPRIIGVARKADSPGG
jgi:hypothetical protein